MTTVYNSEFSASPRIGKLMWLQKANEANAERLMQKDNTKNRTILKKITDEALMHYNNSIQIDKAKMYDKSGNYTPKVWTPDIKSPATRNRVENLQSLA